MKKFEYAAIGGKAPWLAGAAVSVLALTAAAPAYAQDNDGVDETEQSLPVEEPVPQEEVDESASQTQAPGAIVVTGSRIRRDEFSSPSPITVVSPEEAAKSGLVDTADMVQGSPVAAGSNQITAAISSQFVTNGGSGTQTVSLRGLGAERTLVLLNGRRAGPAGTRGAVSAFDLNVIPQQIMQRVDILKDGASSIYGSDAVAGVVNLITKTDTDGLEVDLFATVPFESGGGQKSAAVSWGKSFDRGHVLLAGNYYKQEELRRGDRKYLGCPETYAFTDTTYSTRADLIDPRTGEYQCAGDSEITWGHVWTYDYSYYYTYSTPNLPGSFGGNPPGAGQVTLFQYDYSGTLGNYVPGLPPTGGDPFLTSVPAGWYAVSYDAPSAAVVNNYHPLMDNDSVIPSTERITGYADAAFEIAPMAELYTELLYNNRKNYINASRQVWQFGYPGNFGGFGFGDPFAAGWEGAIITSPTAYTDNFDSSVEVDYYRGVFGVRGEDPNSTWSYDIYGQWSRSDGAYSTQQVRNDAYRSQNLRTGSCVGETLPVSGIPCVDVDWYSGRVMYGAFTPEEEAFLFDWETGHTRYEQKYVEGVVSGDTTGWFELPGGPIGIAIGNTIREDKIHDRPGEISYIEDPDAPGGFVNNAWGVTSSGITAGKTVTTEAFGEINLPILADVPFFQNLELSAAARVTNVKATRASDGLTDENNGNWTYKFAGNWQVNDWLRFRGTYGTSYRAPALFEQFLADQTASIDQRSVDPCINWANNLAAGAISQQFADNCAADGVAGNHTGAGISATTITGGGIGVLEPETSKAWTASVILTPSFSFLPDTQLSLAVDYFNIEVNGEITQLGAANVLAQCYGSEFGLDDPTCALFTRNDDVGSPVDLGNPSNVYEVRDSFINIASQKNSGVDVTGRIVHDFGNDWRFSASAMMTWQTKDNIAVFEGFGIDENGEAGEPKWVGDFRFNLDHGPWNFFYGLDVVGGTDDRPDWYQAQIGDGWEDMDAAALDDALCNQYYNVSPYGNAPVTWCVDLEIPATFYHNASVTREIGDQFRITAGVTNLFNTAPPRASQVGGDGITQFGTGVLTSQYDLIGRRAFINVNVKY